MANFRFVFLTDTHIQPELGATEGVHRALAAVRAENPAFALVGGDLVMDAAAVGRKRAEEVYDLWQQAASDLHLPLHYTVGNHDIFLTQGAEKLPASDPAFGKGFWLRRLGRRRTYDHFDHQGWRFIILDSFTVTAAGGWEGNVDPEQLRWLEDLLRRTPRTMNIVVLSHFPVITAYTLFHDSTTKATGSGMIVQNGKTVAELLRGHRVQAVFQGHTHIVEEVSYLGTRYITGGAVCGDWWKGLRHGVHPEGYCVVDIHDDNLTWWYQPYGWKARRVS